MEFKGPAKQAASAVEATADVPLAPSKRRE
jgi:hypothetical protein